MHSYGVYEKRCLLFLLCYAPIADHFDFHIRDWYRMFNVHVFLLIFWISPSACTCDGCSWLVPTPAYNLASSDSISWSITIQWDKILHPSFHVFYHISIFIQSQETQLLWDSSTTTSMIAVTYKDKSGCSQGISRYLNTTHAVFVGVPTVNGTRE